MTDQAQIITFYSYKGGIGRTSTLANAAWILASNGFRVCVIDWDLEAPGLHRFFHPFLLDRELTSTEGLIDFFVDYVNQAMTPPLEPEPEDWYRQYADLVGYAVAIDWDHFPGSGALDLVVAGRQGPSYAAKVNSFEWQTFYQRFGGGTFLEEVKRQLRSAYDFVLIDSRTGVTDTAGICTAQLPDQLVACFMYNTQSIEGAAAVADSAMRLHVGTPLKVLPVPMRVELAEKERLDRAREFSRHRFASFLSNLSLSEQLTYWSDTEILYQPFYAYEEILAAFSDPVGSKFTILSAVERLCDRLTGGRATRMPLLAEDVRRRVLDEYGQRFALSTYTQVQERDKPASDQAHPDQEAPRARAARRTLSAALADRVGQGLRRRFSGFDRRYRRFVLDSFRYIDVKGLATVGFYTPELDETFVDVGIAFRAPHQIAESLLAQPPSDVTDRRRIEDFLDHVNPTILAVVGAPGTGKTTLLRSTAQTVCLEHRGRRRTIPILLYLRDYASVITDDPGVTLAALVNTMSERAQLNAPVSWFEAQLRNGRCVVLLDGLDEVAGHQDRLAVGDWIEGQVTRYPRNDFVITSRPHGYAIAPIRGATVAQVRGLTSQQVDHFVYRWYRAVERQRTDESGHDVHERADAQAADLLERLSHSIELRDLTVNPLLLTMLINVHYYRGALPDSRASLYSEICQTMLWRRQEAKNLQVTLSGEKKEELLRRLAYTMMQHRMRDLPRIEVEEVISLPLRRMSTTETASNFLADVGASGLLVEREAMVYSFAHITFQEYLAASHIRNLDLVHVLAEAVNDAWWRETTLLYATTGSNIDQIIRACLESGTAAALSLAVDCANLGNIAPELRARLDEIHDIQPG